MLKTCTRCHEEKDTVAFQKAKGYAGGLKSWCRDCQNRYNRDLWARRYPKSLRWRDLDIESRFWRRVNKKDDHECWEWTGCRGGAGLYGSFSVGGKRCVRSHRFSWELANKQPVPAGLGVLHKCDNPICVNPAHLFIGTAQLNSRDCVSKNRHPVARLTIEEVRHIKELLLTHSCADVWRMFKDRVSRGSIHAIKEGRTWSWAA